MKKIKITLTLWLTIGFSLVYGQTILKNGRELKGYNDLHKETIFIHQNASLLLAGEQLYYKMYCIDPETGGFSSLSKMGYVELVGANGQAVFKHKITLSAGVGQGDFFVPTTVPSGNYKLLGFTKWMKNSGENCFFQSDIDIINPYHENQKSILIEAETDSMTGSVPGFEQKARYIQNKTGQNFTMATNKQMFGPRERVELTLRHVKRSALNGNYSISVRKKDAISRSPRATSETFLAFFEDMDRTISVGDSVFMPELRGELVSGKVRSKTTELPVAGERVALSIPGRDFEIKIVQTDKDGSFHFNLNGTYANTDALIQIVGKKGEENKIVMEQPFSMDYGGLVHKELVVGPGMTDLILERSVYNQIENAYLGVKEDTIQSPKPLSPFYRDFALMYNLDDYTRFATIEETLVEIIEHVWVEKNGEGELVFHVRGYDYLPQSGIPPLVLVDGVMVRRHEDIMDISARKLKRIGIIRDECSLGPQAFQGIVALETFDGNFQNTFYHEDLAKIELVRPLPHKKYFQARYGDGKGKITDRIPDFRHQLLWMPNVEPKGEEMTLDFFTSDVPGDYEICLEGFTLEGEPVSLRTAISVE